MRLLFEIDTKDYDLSGRAFVRHSARAVIIKNNRVAMVHSLKYDYYKFPGGGIEEGESQEEALIRETEEESGLVIIPSSIKPYGYVHRIQKSTVGPEDYFLQDNFYYLCGTEEKLTVQKLDDYESEEHFTLEYADPFEVIDINRNRDHGPKDLNMIEREARVLEILIEEGYFNKEK